MYARKRPLLLLTWKTRVGPHGERKHIYSTYGLLLEDLPGYKLSTLKYYLATKKVNFEDNIIKIEKVYLN